MKRFPIQTKGTKIFFNIDLIGYKKTGESIVLSITDELDKVLWCGIIDCFCYKRHNKTKNILKEFGYGSNKSINFLCISHPDLDHIKTISKIFDDFCSEDSMILLPNFKDSNINQTNEIKKIKESLKNMLNVAHPRKSIPNNIFFNQKIGLVELKWEFIVGTKKYNLQIESLTPSDSIMLNSTNFDYTQFKNDFSICLKITFNNNVFLFMGDCTDNVLEELDEYYIPDKLCYLKIPHHGCKNEMMEYYIDNNIINNIIVSGCAYRKNTTLKSTLDYYKDNSESLAVTGNINHEKNTFSYGHVRHVYDIETGDIIADKCNKEGNGILKYF